MKTLEEIRLERANQRRGEPQAKPQTEGHCKTEDPSSGARPSPAVRIKTFSGALAEKNHKRLEEEKQKPEEFPTKTKVESEPKKQSVLAQSVPSKVQLGEPAGKAKAAGEVRIKTLEEIKQEKALRMQQSGENVSAPPAQPEPAPTGKRLLRITKVVGKKIILAPALVKCFPYRANLVCSGFALLSPFKYTRGYKSLRLQSQKARKCQSVQPYYFPLIT